MKRRKELIILIIILATFVFIFYYFWSERKVEHSDKFIEKIDSLDSQVDNIYIIRDSILERIDTVYIKLEGNNKKYEENFNCVINNDASEDYMFFLNYINSNRARLDSISNNL